MPDTTIAGRYTLRDWCYLLKTDLEMANERDAVKRKKQVRFTYSREQVENLLACLESARYTLEANSSPSDQTLEAIVALLNEEINGATRWEWIEGGLGGDLAEKLRALLEPATGAPLGAAQETHLDEQADATTEGPAGNDEPPLTGAEARYARRAVKAVEAMQELADEYQAPLPDGTGNGRAYNAYTVAATIRERLREHLGPDSSEREKIEAANDVLQDAVALYREWKHSQLPEVEELGATLSEISRLVNEQ